jgi:hypothetical protein
MGGSEKGKEGGWEGGWEGGTLSASGRMVAWFLAPKLAWTRFPLAVPRAKMWLPAWFPPTKERA